jgi:hypothetical protein
MKKSIFLFFILLISASLKAQENETVYFYVVSTAFIDGQLKAIVTDVQSTNCHPPSIRSTAIDNQFFDHKKSKYSNAYMYQTVVFDTFKTFAEAANRRRSKIGQYQNDNYHITEDDDFKFYCDGN